MNEQELRAKAADFSVSIDDLKARQRWDALLLTDLDCGYPLTGEEG